MFEFVVAWFFALGGLMMAVVCALNCLGLARGWMRNDAGLIGNLGLGMVSAGLTGFFWALPTADAPVEAWRLYWMLFGSAGFVLMVGSEARRSGPAAGLWRWVSQGARIHTSRSEWQPKHFLVMGAVAASYFALGFVPGDGWWFVVACIPFMVFLDTLKTLPIHFGRRPPNALGPVTKP